MRFLAVFLLILIISMPAWAQQGTTPAGHIFGVATCSPKVPCAGDFSKPMSSAGLAANANACVVNNLGIGVVPPDGFFDDTAGLDGSGCLTLKSDVSTKGTPPRCCVITLPDNSCTFQCELVGR